MADVRLTATNPDDSTVVPVACNEKGELKLEELPDQSFDGNLDGDLIATGKGQFGPVTTTAGVQCNANGSLYVRTGAGIPQNVALGIYRDGFTDSDGVVRFYVDGGAKFANNVAIGSYFPGVQDGDGCYIYANGSFYANRTETSSSVFSASRNGVNKILFTAGGTATFDSDVSTGGSFRVNRGGAFFSKNLDGDYRRLIHIGADNAMYINARASDEAGDGVYIQTEAKNRVLVAKDGNVVIGSAQPKGLLTVDGDTVVGSRNKLWMIVESNGLAHLVEQTRSVDDDSLDAAPMTNYPPLRDIPGELTMVEQQLQKVLEKLRMIPEAGWEVWDGSD